VNDGAHTRIPYAPLSLAYLRNRLVKMSYFGIFSEIGIKPLNINFVI